MMHFHISHYAILISQIKLDTMHYIALIVVAALAVDVSAVELIDVKEASKLAYDAPDNALSELVSIIKTAVDEEILEEASHGNNRAIVVYQDTYANDRLANYINEWIASKGYTSKVERMSDTMIMGTQTRARFIGTGGFRYMIDINWPKYNPSLIQ